MAGPAPARVILPATGFIEMALAAGAEIYAQNCAPCHGANALSGGTAPDLLRSPVPLERAVGCLANGPEGRPGGLTARALLDLIVASAIEKTPSGNSISRSA